MRDSAGRQQRPAGQGPGRAAPGGEARRSPQARLPKGERPASAEELFAQEIPRFRRSERALHWSIAIPFLMCLVSGVAIKLFFNVLHSGLVVRDVLTWVHRISGILLILGPIWVAWRHRNDLSLYFYNVKRAWSWTSDDLKWLALIGLASLSKKIALPEQHKFNAGEKINFMTLMLTYPILAATGVLLLAPGIQFLSFIVHVAIAVLAAPLIVGHIYMAVVNPDTRIGLSGMFSGNVDREWARHHYAKWYREIYGDDEAAPADGGESAATPPATGVVFYLSGGTETVPPRPSPLDPFGEECARATVDDGQHDGRLANKRPVASAGERTAIGNEFARDSGDSDRLEGPSWGTDRNAAE